MHNNLRNSGKSLFLLPIRIVLFILTFSVISVLSERSLTEFSCWWSVIASVINLVVIGIFLVVLRAENISYAKLINYEKGKTKIFSVIVMSVIMNVVGIGGMYLAGYIVYHQFPYLAPMMIAPIPLALAVINLVVLPVTTTVAEDGLYLGFGVNRIESKWLSVFVPAVFYALQHSFIPTIFEWDYMVYRFLSFLPLTCFICGWYQKKRNPLPIMIGHIILNIATAVQILVTSAMPEVYMQMLDM